LHWRCDLWNHSPTGLEWGYGGSGPQQLALALLCDALGDDEAALALYTTYKWEVVAKLLSAGWEITRQEILNWAAEHDPDLADLRAGRTAPDDGLDPDDDDDEDEADDGDLDPDEPRVDVHDEAGRRVHRNVFR